MYAYPLRLEEKEKEKIKEIAWKKRISMGKLLQKAINEYIKKEETPEESFIDVVHKYAGIWQGKDVSYLSEIREKNIERLKRLTK